MLSTVSSSAGGKKETHLHGLHSHPQVFNRLSTTGKCWKGRAYRNSARSILTIGLNQVESFAECNSASRIIGRLSTRCSHNRRVRRAGPGGQRESRRSGTRCRDLKATVRAVRRAGKAASVNSLTAAELRRVFGARRADRESAPVGASGQRIPTARAIGGRSGGSARHRLDGSRNARGLRRS
jgi:hypothetical protein